jgi:predicted SprT family Zn-dependent metalloprotease
MDKIEYTEDYLQRYWSIFNTKYFNNILHKVKIQWSGRMKNWGLTFCEYSYKTRNIITTRIVLNRKAIRTFKRFRMVLVHEMVHQWVYQTFKIKDIDNVIHSRN